MSGLVDAAPSRVLIVADDPAEADSLVSALQEDFETTCASDGGRALELALEHAFDLIIAQSTLPGIGGMDLLTWLKAESRTRDVPVILLAPAAERSAEAEACSLRAGAVDFITMPIRPAILAARAQTHVQLKRQRDLLREYLPHDSLTGIANRRRFNQELLRTWARATREPRPVTVMLLQLDHFGRYADHYGRTPADECLIRSARALHRCFAAGEDLAARHSGDRFALLAEGEKGEEVVRTALGAIADLEIPHVRSETSVFVSASVGAVTLMAGSGSSPEDAMAQAQTLLRLAVQRGRARGELHDCIAHQSTSVVLERSDSRSA